MSALERWCALAARAYADPERRDEVLATLLDANAGRRAPRAGDVVDVVRHGVGGRLRAWPRGEAARRWADAAAVATVGLVTVFAAVAATLVVRFAKERYAVPNYGPRTVGAVLAASALGLATMVAVYAARQRAARALASACAAVTATAAVVAYATGTWRPPAPHYVAILALAGAGLLAALLLTDAVPRAVGVLPTPGWWVAAGTAFAAALAVEGYVEDAAWPSRPRTTALVLVTYAAAAGLLLLLSLPFWASEPRVVAAAALVAVPAAPLALLVVADEIGVTGRSIPYGWLPALLSAAFPLLLGAAALRRVSPPPGT